MKITTKFILVCSVLAGTYFSGNAQKVSVDHYTTKQADCAIFPSTYPTDFEGKPFTPTHDDVDKALKAVKGKLKNVKCSNKDDKEAIIKGLAKYKVQVFGYTDKGGNKLLFLNFFRNDDNKDKDLANSWLTDMIQVQNGGTYFWTIKYDLGKDDLLEFMANGNG